MEITETRVKLVNSSADRLKAYCSITIDGCFVIRDLKVIEGTTGLFVAMPSRKLSARCPSCGTKNHLRTKYCNECGHKIGDLRVFQAANRSKLHADVAHPINAECRKSVQARVIEEYEAELERSRQPGYEGSAYDDEFDDDPSPYAALVEELKADHNRPRPSAAPPADDEPMDEEAPVRAAPPDRSAGEPGSDAFGAGLV